MHLIPQRRYSIHAVFLVSRRIYNFAASQFTIQFRRVRKKKHIKWTINYKKACRGVDLIYAVIWKIGCAACAGIKDCVCIKSAVLA